jgi:hypothetical protein
MSEAYQTPKGVMEQEVDFPVNWTDEKIEAFENSGIKCINWNGFKILSGGSYNMKFFNDLAVRKHKTQSIIILITGAPGEGKTYCGLRLGEIFDKDFEVNLQVAFSREQILYLFGAKSPLKRGQVILIDEAHFSAGARNWYEDLQKDLMNSMAAIRSKGFFIVIVALHKNMLDKIIRQYVLSYMVHIERRGHGIAYSLHTPRFEDQTRYNRIGPVELQIPGFEMCSNPNCLDCRYLYGDRPCMVSRARYERIKNDFLNKVSATSEQKEIDKRMRGSLPPDKELLPMIYEKRYKLDYTGTGTLEWTSLQGILEELGHKVGRTQCLGLCTKLQRTYPDLKREGV